MEPAYDLTDSYDALHFLRDQGQRSQPPGRWHYMASFPASLSQYTEHRPNHDDLSQDQALAALTLIHALHDWLTELEPDVIPVARAAGATWEQLAPVLLVGDRRAAQRRYRRPSRPAGAPGRAAHR
ncbi:hypothetical protein ACH35V_32405 [Actinomadura sp. 1N219]|uniref:hypothetical protein n=1 Tax=Actinomadura sp. 1N219 TaxID=3375152 RepID=UPI0037BB6249